MAYLLLPDPPVANLARVFVSQPGGYSYPREGQAYPYAQNYPTTSR